MITAQERYDGLIDALPERLDDEGRGCVREDVELARRVSGEDVGVPAETHPDRRGVGLCPLETSEQHSPADEIDRDPSLLVTFGSFTPVTLPRW